MAACLSRRKIQVALESTPCFYNSGGLSEYATDDPLPALFSSNFTKRQIYENRFNPVSGFLAAGYTKIPALNQGSDKPQVQKPQDFHSIRIHCVSAPLDTRRVTERDPGSPYPWNSRRLLDARIRSNLRNYADGIISYKEDQSLSSDPVQFRDALANRYMYKSSTQSAYEQVPWDVKLHPHRWKPVSTMECASGNSLFQVRPPRHRPVNSYKL